MTADRKAHWEAVYERRLPEETSWYQATPGLSLALIANSGLQCDEPLIDVGGGASLLVDHLLAAGYQDLTVLDLSARALERAQERLGTAAARVHWIVADATELRPERTYRLWHDRAAFHFLTEAADRTRYLDALRRALAPDGQLVLAAFAPDGPPRCSGLDVVRYDAVSLAAELGPGFRLQEARREAHRTPQGREQHFGFYRFLRTA